MAGAQAAPTQGREGASTPRASLNQESHADSRDKTNRAPRELHVTPPRDTTKGEALGRVQTYLGPAQPLV